MPHGIKHLPKEKQLKPILSELEFTDPPRECNWRETCDKLTESSFFNEHQNGRVPAFLPLYTIACATTLSEHYKILSKSNPRRRTAIFSNLKRAEQLYITWETATHQVFNPKHVPFPKCLW
jgi:hypothetical protein